MNINNTRIRQYVALWKSAFTNSWTELGISQVGTPEITIRGEYVALTDVDQLFGEVASEKVGFEAKARVVFYEVSYAELYSRLLLGQVDVTIDGTKKALIGYTDNISLNRDIAGELRFVPLNATAGDLSEAITFFKSAPKIDMRLISDRTKYQSVEVEFVAFPDPSRKRPGYPFSSAYFCLGDPTTIATPPQFVFASFGDFPIKPYIHTPAFSVAVGDKKKTFWYGAWTTNNAAFTVQVNNAGGYSASATSIAYDNKTVPGASLTDSYIRLGTGEVLYVINDTQSSQSDGTLQVIRGALGSLPAPLNDDDVLTHQDPDSIIILPVTERAQFSSSNNAIATVGNSNSGSLPFGDKGLVTAVSLGNANITAQVDLTISRPLAVTVV